MIDRPCGEEPRARKLRRGLGPATSQEGLPPEETVRAFRTIYLPAREFHFARDDPRGAADLVCVNDPRLEEEPAVQRSNQKIWYDTL